MDDGYRWRAADYVPHAPDAVSVLMVIVLLFASWNMWRTQPPYAAPVALTAAEKPLALKITFFDGTNSARYEVLDPDDFDAGVLLEVHHQFYGHAARANADTEEP